MIVIVAHLLTIWAVNLVTLMDVTEVVGVEVVMSNALQWIIK